MQPARRNRSRAGSSRQISFEQLSDVSARSTFRTAPETCVFDASADGKIVLKFFCSDAPTADALEQPDNVVRFVIVSPVPREMSLASASRLVSMNACALGAPPPVFAQLLVPDVMPNVWLP